MKFIHVFWCGYLAKISGHIVAHFCSTFTHIDPTLIRRVMIRFHLLLALMTSFLIHVHALSFAQRVTFVKNSATLKEIFFEIQKQTGYTVIYQSNLISDVRNLTMNLHDASVEEVMNSSLKGLPLTYVVKDKAIVIKKLSRKVPLRETPPLVYQQRMVSGKVSNENGQPLPGVSVLVKGGAGGATTNKDGLYQIRVVDSHAVLIFRFVGYESKEVPLGTEEIMNISLTPSNEDLSEVVVTALGISREKRSLGYASQAIKAEDVNTVNTGNITNSLSGKAAGVQIRRNTNMGGSTNIVIRGYSSLTGNNQALFVVDGVPIDNSSPNTSDNSFDYGNMASDINPDDVESINILKGAAATALYGSRAANGAVIITTKKGSQHSTTDISLSSGINVGFIDRSTFPKYQNKYGAGTGAVYGPNHDQYFNESDMDGDGIPDLVVPFTAAASFGAPFDPNLLVYQWNALDPESPNYQKKTPWVAAKNGPITFFETPVTYTNNASLAGSFDKGTYRFSYSNYLHNDIMPNSKLKRHNFSLNTSYKLSDKLTFSAVANYIVAQTNGRTEAGSGTSFTNVMATFRNYWQTNIDVKEQGDIYFKTRRNVLAFAGGTTDNIYYVVYESKQSDARNRFFGNASLKYDITDWLNVVGRISVDSYNNTQEDRRNQMTRVPARYTIYNGTSTEANYDLMLNFNKNLSEEININGVLGTNIRRNQFQSVFNTTSNGLIVPNLFSIANSLGTPPPAQEVFRRIGVNGYYGAMSLGYKSMLYLDLTGRADQSSTLPVNNNTYFYPSVTTSFIFSELIKNEVLTFGKLRLNYAQVGSDAAANSLMDVLSKPVPFGSVQLYSINDTKKNEALKPENTVSWEGGVEMSFFKSRLGLDASVYKTNTKDQIMPVAVSSATSYTNKYVNAGNVQNKGIELVLRGTPIKRDNFNWDINVNWAQNRSKVISLFENVKNLQLGSFGAGVSLNAQVGLPYGMWYGTDFIYVDGKREIDQTTGEYKRTTTTNNIIGNMNPDWNGGVLNKFTYKNLSLSFLIDVQKGGDIFSNDLANGIRDGLYDDITVSTNDLGNPVRNSLANGGGLILEGVDADGNPNMVRTRMDNTGHALGSNKAPQALFIYDASYIKLREASLAYQLPARLFKDRSIRGIKLSLIGSNLWIIHKNIPYADPEAGLGAGNVQGYQVGVYPTTRTVGFNVQVQF